MRKKEITMKELTIFNRRYLGSKQKLLNFIEDSLEKEGVQFESIIDIFAGTAVVANHFAKTKRVIVNDLLKFNYFSYVVWFGNDSLDKKKLDFFIDEYNNLDVIEENYLSKTFTETYFSSNDTRKIGFIRDDIENKYNSNLINERERCYLITSLIYSADKIANTVGHYDAYRKIGKLEDKFIMYPLQIENYNRDNEFYCEDANVLIKKIQGDLLYIDPPYNSRQYCDAYHLLENLALWEKPKVSGVALKMDRDSMKSNYCTKKALSSFSELIENANVKYIVVSYNNMYEKGAGRSQSILKETDILSVLSKKGLVKVYEKDFQPFSTGKTNIENHKERLYICRVNQFDNSVCIKSNEKSKSFVKSPLNYTGGKFKIISELLDIFPKEINKFVDLFCGGANVSVNVNANEIIAYDYSVELINLFNYLKKYDYIDINKKIEDTISEFGLSYTYLNRYEFYNSSSSDGVGKYNKEGYAKLKEKYNSLGNENEIKNLYFLVLIIYGFNNQIRFNSKGLFNIPVGKRDYNSSIKKNLNAFITKIREKDITFISSDFRNIDLSSLSIGDFVYLDPPYLLGCATYNESDGWNKELELQMYDLIKKLDSKGVKFALSNVIEHKGQKHTLLSEFAISNRYNIHFVDRNYNNASYHVINKESKTVEVVITNY